jgi:hypothetical protein
VPQEVLVGVQQAQTAIYHVLMGIHGGAYGGPESTHAHGGLHHPHCNRGGDTVQQLHQAPEVAVPPHYRRGVCLLRGLRQLHTLGIRGRGRRGASPTTLPASGVSADGVLPSCANSKVQVVGRRRPVAVSASPPVQVVDSHRGHTSTDERGKEGWAPPGPTNAGGGPLSLPRHHMVRCRLQGRHSKGTWRIPWRVGPCAWVGGAPTVSAHLP